MLPASYAQSDTPSESFIMPSPLPICRATLLSSAFAKRKRALNRLVNAFSSLGAQLDMSLPRIAVIGNQSAGKSSLVEAISGIKMPRDAGTCTRCPFEVRLQQDSMEWSCAVKLRFMYDDINNVSIPVREEDFGGIIYDPDAVEDRLRRAQLAILNPNLPATDLLKAGLDCSTVQKILPFSRNVICVEIGGPDLTDLSFVDLPGIISNALSEEVHFIENLVNEYITQDCLILLTLSMKEEIELQRAAWLAQNADIKQLRTIGVLTKPDTLESGAEGSWLDTFCGAENTLYHGYYVVKQPSADDRRNGMTFDQARRAEDNFFRNAPWAGLEPTQKERMGTKALAEALSQLLCNFISERLPSLEQQIVEQHATTVRLIRALPQPPSEDPCSEMYHLCGKFRLELAACVEGALEHESLWQDIRTIFTNLKRDVHKAIPSFLPFVDDGEHNLDDGDKEQDRHLVYLSQVRKIIDESITRQLPFEVPYGAKIRLMKIPLPAWEAAILGASAAVKPIVDKLVREAAVKVFGRWSHGNLDKRVLDLVAPELKKLGDNCDDFLGRLASLESIPWSQNSSCLNQTRNSTLKDLRHQRSRFIAARPQRVMEHQWSRKRGRRSTSPKAAEGPGTDNDDDSEAVMWDTEMIAGAEATAYIKVAYKRIIDEVPLAIVKEFLEPLPDAVGTSLIRRLGITNVDRCRSYLRENPKVARSRKELQAKCSRLELEMNAFNRFAMGEEI